MKVRMLIRLGLLAIVGLSAGIFYRSGLSPFPSPSSRQPVAVASGQPRVSYQTTTTAQRVVHVLSVPSQSTAQVRVGWSETLAPVQQWAERTAAIGVLNAGFFDPMNQRSTSFVTVDGQPVGDPHQNRRLTENPQLRPYLAKIFQRSEFRHYRCDQIHRQIYRYDIVPHQASVPASCQLVDAVGGGPQLLPEFTAIAEGFVDPQTGRDAIGVNQPNARSAVGLKADGTVLLVMVAQVPKVANSGISLPELATLMTELGAQKALNLDGGTSSALFYQGKTIYGRRDRFGNPVRRPVKSVFYIQNS